MTFHLVNESVENSVQHSHIKSKSVLSEVQKGN